MQLETAVRVSRPARHHGLLRNRLCTSRSGDDARQLIEQITNAPTTHYDPLLKVAWIYAALGDRNRACIRAEKVLPKRGPLNSILSKVYQPWIHGARTRAFKT